jgi:hypothetical protein
MEETLVIGGNGSSGNMFFGLTLVKKRPSPNLLLLHDLAAFT